MSSGQQWPVQCCWGHGQLPTCWLLRLPALLRQVRTHNETRGRHGRFLLGHAAVDGCRGGLFMLDASNAQPFGGQVRAPLQPI